MLNRAFIYDSTLHGELRDVRKDLFNLNCITGISTNELFITYCVNRCTGIAPKDITIKRDLMGKPYLLGLEYVHFNLSSSRDILTCIVSESPVGIDIEEKRIYSIDKKFKAFFSTAEWASLCSEDTASFSFFELWTCKESYAKFLGNGLKLPFSSFTIHKDNTKYSVTHPQNPTLPNISVINLKSQYYIAVCSPKKIHEELEYVSKPLIIKSFKTPNA